MKKALSIYLSVIAVLASCLWQDGRVVAQDAHLSQYYAAPLAINPAMTGMFEGKYRASLTHRSQWMFLDKAFTTDYFAYDQPWKKFGFGAYLWNNRAGTSTLNQLSIILSGAYEVTVDNRNIHNLTTGLQLGAIQKSLDVNNLTYDSQYDKYYADGDFNPNISSGETFGSTTYWLPEVNFGIYYHYNNPKYKFSPYVSAAGYHLTQPRESFFGNKQNRQPIKIVGYGGSKYYINDELYLDANLLFMRKKNNNTINFGVLGYYHFEGSDYTVFIGPYYRNKDAIIMHLGILWQEYALRFSYDVNTSPLKQFSGSRGGFEVSLTYTKERKRYMPSLIHRHVIPQF
ncbi:PorP/SprF family type IX secretion system membrane protein [Bacteroidales bacterium AH-315-I05]|nr:PorP/SprF family type IX secretion system membrane protein [Bacteroidales bacterium AH-315-I05]